MRMEEAGPAIMTSRARRVEVRGELEGEPGGTCHNDKPGQMMGMMMGVEERSR